MKTNLLLTAALSLSLCAASTAQTLSAYLPTDGLVGWWPFNGNANDESGNGNDGTVNGATLAQDRFGVNNQAYYFNGQTDFISIPDGGGMLPANLSISAWIKIPSEYTGNQGSGFTRIIRSRFFGYTISFIEPSNSLFFEIYTNASSGSLIQTNDIITNDDNWHHVVGNFDGSMVKFYFDGNLIGQAATNENGIFYSSDGLVMFGKDGNSTSPGTAYFQGWLDDIAIYNRALSPEEITALYTGEPVNPPTACNPLPANLQNGLVGYWPFCGNANDESGNGNDGTVNGATLTEDRFGAANAAYGFDGNDVIENSTWSGISSNQEFTVNFWTKYQPSLGWLVSFGQPSNSNAFHIGTAFQESKLYSAFWNFGFSPITNNYPIVELDSIWTMVTVVYDNDTVFQRINGQQASSFASDEIQENLLSGELNFGKQIGNYAEYFIGSLDDIGIWNRALTAEEVQQLYTLNACTFTVYDTVTVTQTVYDTVTTYTTVTDTLIINTLITELAPPANTNTIKVFPNPAGSTLTIDYGNYALMNGYQLRIENSLGQEVFQTNISQQSDTLSLGSWGGNGLYFVHIVDPQGNTVDIRKIVLQ